MSIVKKVIICIAVVLMAACKPVTTKINPVAIDPAKFVKEINGKQTGLFVLQNKNGIKVSITNYGARIVAIEMPDKNGKMADIVLGFDNIDEYLTERIYLGCIVGRYANRIDGAKFTLDGQEYHLFKNDGNNTLHGGKEGFDKKVWDAVQDSNAITLTYTSPDGEEGYPGNLMIKQTFTLNDNNELRLEYEAQTDKATVINLTNHTYLNLKGEGDTTVLDHYFMINANYATPVDSELIPTGEIASIENSPLGFMEGKKIGQDINADNDQILNGGGYDHNWILNKDSIGSLSLACKLWEETTGRVLEVYTTEPAMQFYSGNFLDGSIIGKSGKPYKYRSAMIFEPQHYPDSPNNDNFPGTALNPGEKYHQLTVIKFEVVK